ncbi:MAG TPA: DUF167 domain-containing protein [Rhizomicrobium sp.]|nr:DUF167 domain-containing protein [Rhizomicrobium sp.]
MKPYSITEKGVRLAVRLTPRAARDGIAGLAQDAEGRPFLAIRLTAPPVDGAANKALIAFLAKALGLRKADIEIRSGETGRLKILDLSGDGRIIAQGLDALAGSN